MDGNSKAYGASYFHNKCDRADYYCQQPTPPSRFDHANTSNKNCKWQDDKKEQRGAAINQIFLNRHE